MTDTSRLAYTTTYTQRMSLHYAVAYLLFLICSTISAQTTKDSVSVKGNVVNAVEVEDSVSSKARKRNLFTKVVDYFRNANKPRPMKKVDFGVLPGPHYSSTTGLGLGIIGTATYSADQLDPTLPRSNASIYTDMTTGGYFLVGLRGNHIFPHERFRLDYKTNISTFSADFYGIGYTVNDFDNNKVGYRRNRITAMGRFMFRLAPNTYLGPLLHYRVYQAKDIDDNKRERWGEEHLTVNALTAGFAFTYDTRDFMLNAQKGIFVQFDQTFTPGFLISNNYHFATSEATLCGYKRLWKDAVLAGELHGMFNYGRVPWTMLAEVGTSERMRGYYEGRYRDKNLIEGQIELRQHIKGRSGAVLWAGMANAFPSFDEIAWRKTLKNFGVGYRWEFKKGINVRIDYGFTRNGGGLIFSINEAF